MSHSFKIVACLPDDAERISKIAIRAYKDFYLYLWKDDGSWYINRCFTASVVAKELKDSNAAYFLLLEGDVEVGFLKLNIDQPLEGFESYACLELERIYLLKSASGKGYGRRAMEFCFEYARKNAKELIWLKAMDSSESVNFYERMGFTKCGSLRLDYEPMKPSLRGMVIMKRLLN